ncbi:long-chain fatty acid--CoA ligase [bacterium]|nr:long-chain fatty acid--CoA ligase [bacterium]
MNNRDILEKIRMRYVNRELMVFQNRRLTGSQYVERVYRLGNALLSLGLKKGDRVALLLQNSNISSECFHGANSAGLPFVPLNSRNSSLEHLHILNHSIAKAIIVDEVYLDILEPILPRAASIQHVICVSVAGDHDYQSYETLLNTAKPDEPDVDIFDDDICSLRYTSGTTGKPKGVIHSYKSDSVVLINSLLEGLDIRSTDAVALTSPVTHASGSQILPHLVKGARVVIMPEFNPEKLMQVIEKEQITTLYMVPTMLIMLINHPALANYDLSSIRTIRYGASPISPSLLEKAIDIFGNVFVQGYGLTEAGMPITLLTKDDHSLDGSEWKLKRLKSVGREVIVAKVRIMDDENNLVPPGETGEIVVKTDQNMLGYWNDPVATDKTVQDNWLRTGDVGYIDEDGYVYLVDRKKDMIISGGFNIYSREVEDVLYSHDAILEAAVIGVPDDTWGESVKAVVVLKPDKSATSDDIIKHCRKHLAAYKKPSSIEFVDKIPKNANGKIMKAELKEQFWDRHDRKIN